MKQTTWKYLTAFILVCALLMSGIHVNANGNVNGTLGGQSSSLPPIATYTPKPIGKVLMGNASYMELKEAYLLGRTIRFTVTIYNGDNTSLEFMDYWVRLKSNSGAAYTVSLLNSDKDRGTIEPKTSEEYVFTANIREGMQLQDLIFEFIRWDFTAPSYAVSLGTIKIPANYSNTTPAGQALSLKIAGGTVKAQIKRHAMTRSGAVHGSSLRMEFENTGTKNVVIPSYQYLLVTSEGITYPLEVIDLAANTSVQPKFKKEFTLKGTIPTSISTKGWRLVIADAATEGNTLYPIATFDIPAATAVEEAKPIEVGQRKEVQVAGQTLEVRLNRTIRDEQVRGFDVKMEVSFTNKGKRSITLPQYTFEIETAGGYLYPVTLEATNVKIDPQTEREIILRATLPKSVVKTGWLLQMNEPLNSAKPDEEAPSIASFVVSDLNPVQVAKSERLAYENKIGKYVYVLRYMQRLPWDNEDVLTAELFIYNDNNKSIRYPTLKAYILLEEDKIEANVVFKDSGVSIKPNSHIQAVVYAKIPYSYDIEQARIILEDHSDAALPKRISSYAWSNSTTLPIIAQGQYHDLRGTGRTSRITIRETRNYQNDEFQMYTTLMNITNLEKRHIGMPSVVAHFQSPDGMIFPATLTQTDPKIGPSITRTMMAYAEIPKTVDTTGFKLILGEGVVKDKLSVGAAAESYVSGVLFDLPAETLPTTVFNQVELFPYKLSINQWNAKIITDTNYTLEFQYNLSRIIGNGSLGRDHKLIVELTDNNSNLYFVREFALSPLSNTITTDLNLYVGSNKKIIDIDDPAVKGKLKKFDPIIVRVYDSYLEAKKLINAEVIQWQ
jgi:hypothetical protein